jgi:hypothetical protein
MTIKHVDGTEIDFVYAHHCIRAEVLVVQNREHNLLSVQGASILNLN